MCACLLHHRMWKPAHVQRDLRMLERAVVPTLTRQQAPHTDFPGAGFIG